MDAVRSSDTTNRLRIKHQERRFLRCPEKTEQDRRDKELDPVKEREEAKDEAAAVVAE